MGVGGIGGGMGGGIAGSIGGEQGGESAPGLLAPTSSGGYSYIMKPLGGESPAFYQASVSSRRMARGFRRLASITRASLKTNHSPFPFFYCTAYPRLVMETLFNRYCGSRGVSAPTVVHSFYMFSDACCIIGCSIARLTSFL